MENSPKHEPVKPASELEGAPLETEVEDPSFKKTKGIKKEAIVMPVVKSKFMDWNKGQVPARRSLGAEKTSTSATKQSEVKGAVMNRPLSAGRNRAPSANAGNVTLQPGQQLTTSQQASKPGQRPVRATSASKSAATSSSSSSTTTATWVSSSRAASGHPSSSGATASGSGGGSGGGGGVRRVEGNNPDCPLWKTQQVREVREGPLPASLRTSLDGAKPHATQVQSRYRLSASGTSAAATKRLSQEAFKRPVSGAKTSSSSSSTAALRGMPTSSAQHVSATSAKTASSAEHTSATSAKTATSAKRVSATSEPLQEDKPEMLNRTEEMNLKEKETLKGDMVVEGTQELNSVGRSKAALGMTGGSGSKGACTRREGKHGGNEEEEENTAVEGGEDAERKGVRSCGKNDERKGEENKEEEEVSKKASGVSGRRETPVAANSLVGDKVEEEEEQQRVGARPHLQDQPAGESKTRGRAVASADTPAGPGLSRGSGGSSRVLSPSEAAISVEMLQNRAVQWQVANLLLHQSLEDQQAAAHTQLLAAAQGVGALRMEVTELHQKVTSLALEQQLDAQVEIQAPLLQQWEKHSGPHYAVSEACMSGIGSVLERLPLDPRVRAPSLPDLTEALMQAQDAVDTVLGSLQLGIEDTSVSSAQVCDALTLAGQGAAEFSSLITEEIRELHNCHQALQHLAKLEVEERSLRFDLMQSARRGHDPALVAMQALGLA